MKTTPMWERRRQLFGEPIITPRPDIELIGFTSAHKKDIYPLLTDASVADNTAIEFVARLEGKSPDKFIMGKRINTDKLSYIEVVRPYE